MRRIFLGFLVLGSVSAFALPKPRDVEQSLNTSATAGPRNLLGYQLVSNKMQSLKCKWDFAASGGSSVGNIPLKGPDGGACLLPKGAIVVYGFLDVVSSALASAGVASIAVSTGQAGADLLAATGATTLTTGILKAFKPSLATMESSKIKLTADATPAFSLSSNGLSTGTINTFINYYLSD